MIKQGVRILAIDDSSFSRKDKEALVVGVVGRQEQVEGILSFRVKVDGNEATQKVLNKIRKSHFKDQIKLVVLHGITLAGLNMVDILELNGKLKLPVMSIIRRKPHSKELQKAIKLSGKHANERLALLNKLNSKLKITRSSGFYMQYVGIGTKEVTKFQAGAVRFLRFAHLIANGIARGESKGRI